jgi:hypothetical protein
MSDRVPPTDRPFTVIVRPKHFDGAVRESANRCVIAQALKHTFPDIHGDHVIVGSKDLRLPDAPLLLDATGPRWYHDGRYLVREFDQGRLHAEDAKAGIPVTFTPVPRPPFPGKE